MDPLSIKVRQAYEELAKQSKGCIKNAQTVAKLLHKASRKREAANLVREYNKIARLMRRQDW